MRKVAALAIREWKVFFHTPFALVLLPAYYLLCGTYFFAKLDGYLQLANPNETITKVHGLNVATHLLIPFFQDLTNVFILLVPLITMRTFAEEKKFGTYDLLVSYPLRPVEILAGKYIGLSTIILAMLATSTIFPAIVMWKGQPYPPQLYTTYLGLVLFLLFYVAAGVVASLLTENQLVAAIITYGTFLSSVLFQWFAYVAVAPWDRFFANFLLPAHLQSFRLGLVFLGDIAAYLCITLAILFFGYWQLRRHFYR